MEKVFLFLYDFETKYSNKLQLLPIVSIILFLAFKFKYTDVISFFFIFYFKKIHCLLDIPEALMNFFVLLEIYKFVSYNQNTYRKAYIKNVRAPLTWMVLCYAFNKFHEFQDEKTYRSCQISFIAFAAYYVANYFYPFFKAFIVTAFVVSYFYVREFFKNPSNTLFQKVKMGIFLTFCAIHAFIRFINVVIDCEIAKKKQKCDYCGKDIRVESSFIQLKCGHNYHIQCFELANNMCFKCAKNAIDNPAQVNDEYEEVDNKDEKIDSIKLSEDICSAISLVNDLK